MWLVDTLQNLGFLEVLQNVVPFSIPGIYLAIVAVPVLMGIVWVLPAYLSVRKH